MRVLRRLLLVLVVLALVVAGGVVATDGLLRAEAERRTAAQLEQQAHLTAPSVHIDGWPFLWRAVTGFDEVRVSASTLAVQGEPQVRLDDPRFTLTGVVYRPDRLSARGVTGSARLSYAELSRLAGRDITVGGDGRLSHAESVDVFGVRIPVVVSGSLRLDEAAGTVSVAEPRVEVGGVQLPQRVVDDLAARAVQPVAVPLPAGLRLASVSPTGEGLALTIRGQDVTFPLA